jgi:LysR family glycine cleavage system transcriptional activator
VVGVGSSFSANWLVHRLGAFYQKFPEINLHLKIFNNESDFSSGGTDMAVVWGIGDWQGLMCEKLMVVEFTPVCSPELIKKTHPLKTPEDLIHYPLLDDPDYDIWQQWLEEAGIPERKYKRRTVIRDANVVIHSALEGHGIALCAVGIVQEYLDSGRLIRPFDHSITGGGFYYLVYPEKALRKPPVRLFKTWLVQEVRKAESMDHTQ